MVTDTKSIECEYLVSVITPCHNGERTLRQTIESVISQTYSNWEMLIIDDCSSDNTSSIIHQYAMKDNRIKYFKTTSPSGSPSLPRNIGIDNAKGDYIAFLDADDIWLPDKLQKQIRYIKSNGYSFVYSDYEKISANGERNNRIIKMPTYSSFWDVLESCTIPCLTVVLSKKIIGKTRFKFIPKEDYAFWLDILKQDISAHNVGEVLALYREQPNSRSANKIDMIRQQWYVLRKIEGIKSIPASYFMLKFIFRGLIKYLK